MKGIILAGGSGTKLLPMTAVIDKPFCNKNFKAGDVITPDSIRRIRPGYGLAPKFESEIIGRRVKTDVEIGIATLWDLILNKA